MHAAKWVARAFAPEAEVVLLHCLSPLLVLKHVGAARSKANRALRELERAIDPERCAHAVRVGDPARALADFAAEIDADLIAVGAHEEHPDRLPSLGSTAERLVRCSPVPVLLCATTPAAAPRSVLLPLDSGEVTTELAEWTESLAERFDARLAMVHVEPTTAGERLTTPPARCPSDAVTPWSRVARELPPQRVFVDAVLGDPADAVLAESRRFKSELVMLQAGDWMAKDDATDPVTRVIRRSECPVLVIPPSTREVAHV
jgi:nucleotide-binding universal stress UspA family protein